MMLNALKKETNFTETENGGITHKSSESKVLDYFAQGSALRERPLDSIIELVEDSMKEDKLLTLKILFNSRDIRNGQGERNTFRIILNYLAKKYPDEIKKNIANIPMFGRWDDIYALFDTPLEINAIQYIAMQLFIDVRSNNPSLCAKWLASENTSSKETRRLARKTREGLSLSPKTYRKLLSELRKKIDIVETKLSNKDYSAIEYDKLPSQASLKYKDAFIRNDEDRYTEYLLKLSEGKAKVNTGTLLPYQLVKKVLYDYIEEKDRILLNEMWNNLPSFITEEDHSDTLAVVDVSGSMGGTPMEMSISLGLYLAEHNQGAFKNHFITFSATPKLVQVKGEDFVSKVQNIKNASWGYSTNIEATFDLILSAAINNNLTQEDLPDRIVIISDMEFDEAVNRSMTSMYVNKKRTEMEKISDKFKRYGYKMPRLVFWNVNSRQNNLPMTNQEGVQLVSGPSPRLFEQIVKDVSAYDLMLEILNNEIYDCITI